MRFVTDTKEKRCYLLVRHLTTIFPTPGHMSWCHGGILAYMSVVTTGTPEVYHLLPICTVKVKSEHKQSLQQIVSYFTFCLIFMHFYL